MSQIIEDQKCNFVHAKKLRDIKMEISANQSLEVESQKEEKKKKKRNKWGKKNVVGHVAACARPTSIDFLLALRIYSTTTVKPGGRARVNNK